MKGYTPNLKVNKEKELNSKTSYSFIELGVKQSKCPNECDCEVCKGK